MLSLVTEHIGKLVQMMSCIPPSAVRFGVRLTIDLPLPRTPMSLTGSPSQSLKCLISRDIHRIRSGSDSSRECWEEDGVSVIGTLKSDPKFLGGGPIEALVVARGGRCVGFDRGWDDEARSGTSSSLWAPASVG